MEVNTFGRYYPAIKIKRRRSSNRVTTVNKKPPRGRGHRFPDADAAYWRGSMIALLALFLLFTPAGGHADEPQNGPLIYRSVPIEPAEGLFVVTHDVNVRDRPDTNGEKLGLIEEGETVRVFGRAEGSWVAVKQHGKDIGFVYAPVLHRLFDGELDQDIRRHAVFSNGRICDYLIRYSGSSPVEGEIFETSDYEVGWRCRFGEQTREFESFLFVSEALEDDNDGRLYQITLDIWEIGGGIDDQVFSSTVLYDREKSLVSFDSISLEDYASGAPPVPKPAHGVLETLVAAVELCASSWNEKAWKAIESIAH